MFARLLILFYAIVSYAVFLVSFLYALGFVGNYLVPKSIDVGGPANLSEAIVVDLLLLGIFAIQHSIMARPAFKQWWAKILPVACQRSTYVLLSSLIFLLLFWQWRPIPIPVWRIDGIAAWLLIGVYWLGWLITLASTFMIDHFDLSGLRQAFFALRGAEVPGQSFKTPLLYKIVRHPLMLGFLLAFWATPEMTAGHLLFAIMTTAYILVGLQFEERDLIAEFGTTYQQYRRRVPMLLPRIFGRRRAEDRQTDARSAIRERGAVPQHITVGWIRMSSMFKRSVDARLCSSRHGFLEIRGTYLKELLMDWNTTLGLTLLSVVAGLMLGRAVAQTDAPSVVTLTPPEMKWTSQGALAAPGLEQLNLIGDPAKAGPYTLRLKFPKGFRIAPHTHPDSREVTILSGVFATGYGESFDNTKLKILPAGSFYTEPANVPHYIEIEEDTVLQVSGTGPSGRKFIPPEIPN
jgi:protein-S-isoprenylcysteine O-methyltransferase Ste14/quercetin dioxygenase-like cupin family protein